MAKYNRIDAGLSVLFDIHKGKCSDLVPQAFVISKTALEKTCGLRGLRTSKLVEEIADAVSGLGFIRACGHWAVSELEYDKVLFQLIPETIKVMVIERGSVSFHSMNIQQVLNNEKQPVTAKSLVSELDCVLTGCARCSDHCGETANMKQVKKRRGDVDEEVPFDSNRHSL